MGGKKKVIIRRCADYDPELIKSIIQEGLEEFGLTSKIRGRVTIKPNVVMAHRKTAPSAFTRPEFLTGLLSALVNEKKDELNIGLLLDRERMWNHNYNLDEKIIDLLEVGFPDFIATDAIEISLGGNQMTQHGKHLGMILMAENPLAHDVVCAHILHLDPHNIKHLRIAHERGYGPLRLDEIESRGSGKTFLPGQLSSGNIRDISRLRD